MRRRRSLLDSSQARACWGRACARHSQGDFSLRPPGRHGGRLRLGIVVSSLSGNLE